METLNNVVTQLDRMNTTMKDMESRIDHVESNVNSQLDQNMQNNKKQKTLQLNQNEN